MKSIRSAGFSESVGDHCSAPFVFHATLLYEDLTTGILGKARLDRLRANAAEDGELHLSLWRFNLLEDSRLRRQAAEESAMADLVMLSAHRADPWPAGVQTWLCDWSSQRLQKPCAFVVALDHPTTALTVKDLPECFQTVASQAGVQLFLSPVKAQPLQHDAGTRQWILPAGEFPTAGDEMPHGSEPLSRWGINE